jgi:hypothetical protein
MEGRNHAQNYVVNGPHVAHFIQHLRERAIVSSVVPTAHSAVNAQGKELQEKGWRGRIRIMNLIACSNWTSLRANNAAHGQQT